MNISDYVRKAMAEANVSAYEIANRNNGKPSEQAIKDIARGKTKSPGIRIMLAIGESTRRTVSQLIGEVEPPAEIPRGPCTMDDLRHCIDDMGISTEMQRVIMVAAEEGVAKGSGKKRQLG